MSYKLSIVKNKMMKRIINILILLCCIASLSSCGNSTEERSRVLKIYNWADYIDEDVLAEFPDWYKQQTGEDLRIIYQVFDINEIMLTKIERGHEDFDVVCPSEYIIERMLRKALLLPIDRNFGHTPDYIPNVSPYIRHELNKTSQPERQTEDYAVPYMWGTTGLIYNTTMVEEPPTKWADMWDVAYTNNVLMFNNSRDAYAIAAKTIGLSMNPQSVDEITAITDALKAQKNIVQAYVMDEVFDKMEGGEAAMAPYYAGDAITMIDENPDLAFVHPEEGVNFFIDSMCIPANAKHREAAEMFINYLCEPDVGLANADFIGYSTPITAVWEMLDDDLKYSEIAYPSAEVLDKAEVFETLPDDINAAMDAQWSEMKSYEDGGSGWMVVALLLLAIAISAFNIWRKLRKKSRDNY